MNESTLKVFAPTYAAENGERVDIRLITGGLTMRTQLLPALFGKSGCVCASVRRSSQ